MYACSHVDIIDASPQAEVVSPLKAVKGVYRSWYRKPTAELRSVTCHMELHDDNVPAGWYSGVRFIIF